MDRLRRILPTAALAALQLVSFISVTTVRADNTVLFQSSAIQTPLLELYSSEGCSSCPPAEEYLTELRKHKGLWRDFVPIQFHVDYWDNLGWPDIYAKKEFTVRQRQYSSEFHGRTIYTPEFIFGGKEARSPSPAPLDEVSGKRVGVLLVRRAADGVFSAQFTPERPLSDELLLNGALLENGVETKVTAGENRGETLRHDFVALDLRKVSFQKRGDSYVASMQLASPERRGAGQSLSAAFWISSTSSLAPIQSVGGDLK